VNSKVAVNLASEVVPLNTPLAVGGANLLGFLVITQFFEYCNPCMNAGELVTSVILILSFLYFLATSDMNLEPSPMPW